MRRLSIALFCLISVISINASAQAASYATGFTWNRNSDYKAGTIPGSTTGNPGKDSMGNPTWSYANVAFGNPFGATPWYKQTPTLMPWVADWANSGASAWAEGQNLGPVIGGTNFYQSLWSDMGSKVPVSIWTNPAGTLLNLSLTGQITIDWLSFGLDAAPTCDVDLILTRYTPSTGTYYDVIAQTLSRPVTNKYIVPVNMTVAVNSEDQLLLSMRGNQAPGGMQQFIRMDDHLLNYQITPVPEPGSLLGLLAGMGGITGLMLRKRK